MGDGFPRLVARDENQPQVVIRASVRRIERQRGAKLLFREVRLAFGEIAVAEIIVRVGRVRVEPQCLFERRLRARVVLLLDLDQAKQVVPGRALRIERKPFFDGLACLLERAFGEQFLRAAKKLRRSRVRLRALYWMACP